MLRSIAQILLESYHHTLGRLESAKESVECRELGGEAPNGPKRNSVRPANDCLIKAVYASL
jgi:hypothetical protein